jgi:hypothetical protein
MEDVLDYAVKLAAFTKEDNMAEPDKGPPEAPGQAEKRNEEEESPDQKTPEKADKLECSGCGQANDDDAKYCDKCGKMIAEEDDTEVDDENEETGEKPDHEEPDGDEPPAKASTNQPPLPAKDRRTESLAALVGLRDGASVPAIKAALLPIVALRDYALSLTETRTEAEARGALKAMSEDAAAAGKLRVELRNAQRAANARERTDLLQKLSRAGLPGYTRGELFVDVVDESSGKRTVKPAPVYAEMKLDTLRGLVSQKLANAPKSKSSPFEPSKEHAEAAAASHRVSVVSTSPFIQTIASRSTATVEQLAQSAAALAAMENHQ